MFSHFLFQCDIFFQSFGATNFNQISLQLIALLQLLVDIFAHQLSIVVTSSEEGVCLLFNLF